ncbi:MAG: nicotinate phosphoribosyltransferase [bacterium]|nr:nicotinate phosphoribosyltransferase [bacterium]
MIRNNFLLNSDSYKYSHFWQYPPGTQFINSYIEPRLSRNNRFHQTMFFGLQAFLKEYLEGEVVTMEKIDEAEELIVKHGLPFYRGGWEHIVKRHGGQLPIEIEAVSEGTVVDNGNVVLQIRNTDPDSFFLPSFIETSLLRSVWFGSTVSTNSWKIKRLIKYYLEKTADDLSGLPFKLNDFSYRGVSSMETGELGGLAHLVNFQGTDTVGALVAARKYYHEDCAGYSIPAMEHSSVTSWGKDGEADSFSNMLDNFAKPGTLVACVSDSYDIDNAVKNIWCGDLKQKVIDSGCTLVVRPDSGDVVDTPVKVIDELAKGFGTTTNSKGFKVLNHVRCIQGDGVGYTEIESILNRLMRMGYSADNIAFGMGNKLVQMVTRDDSNFSMKCSEIVVDGEARDVFKESPGKKSKRGRLALVKRENHFVTVRVDELVSGSHGKETNYLRPVFKNGSLLVDESLATIRERSEAYC